MYTVKEWQEGLRRLFYVINRDSAYVKKCSNCKYHRNIDGQDHIIECDNDEIVIDLTYTKDDFYCSEYERIVELDTANCVGTIKEQKK